MGNCLPRLMANRFFNDYLLDSWYLFDSIPIWLLSFIIFIAPPSELSSQARPVCIGRSWADLGIHLEIFPQFEEPHAAERLTYPQLILDRA
jgi:hypothetical protein